MKIILAYKNVAIFKAFTGSVGFLQTNAILFASNHVSSSHRNETKPRTEIDTLPDQLETRPTSCTGNAFVLVKYSRSVSCNLETGARGYRHAIRQFRGKQTRPPASQPVPATTDLNEISGIPELPAIVFHKTVKRSVIKRGSLLRFPRFVSSRNEARRGFFACLRSLQPTEKHLLSFLLFQ